MEKVITDACHYVRYAGRFRDTKHLLSIKIKKEDPERIYIRPALKPHHVTLFNSVHEGRDLCRLSKLRSNIEFVAIEVKLSVMRENKVFTPFKSNEVEKDIFIYVE